MIIRCCGYCEDQKANIEWRNGLFDVIVYVGVVVFPVF